MVNKYFMEDERIMIQSEYNVPNSARKVMEIWEDRNKREKDEQNYKKHIEEGALANIEQKKLIKSQIDLLYEQNKSLSDNYDKLREIYSLQCQANEEAKRQLKRSRIFNLLMMIISFISMLATIMN